MHSLNKCHILWKLDTRFALADTSITDPMAIIIFLACNMGDFCIPLVHFMD